MSRTPVFRVLKTGVALAAFLALATCGGKASGQIQDPTPGYEIVAEFDHDTEAFTQGLTFWKGRFFESTGQEGESSMREVDLETGEVIRQVDLADRHFGEGMTIKGRRAYMLTWRSEVAFVYRPSPFRRVGRFRYDGEGWGLTHNKRFLIMSDGTSAIDFRDPDTFKVKKSITVTREGEELEHLNELEWIGGSIYANVWTTDDVVIIDPATGEVTDSFNLSFLREKEEATGDPDVTNGIAYLRSEDRLFVTGKLWAHVYEIELTD